MHCRQTIRVEYSHGSNYTFALDSSGRKYHKVFMYINGQRDSIHAFIDKKTGDVFKPASFKAPAKSTLQCLNIQSREKCLSVLIGQVFISTSAEVIN